MLQRLRALFGGPRATAPREEEWPFDPSGGHEPDRYHQSVVVHPRAGSRIVLMLPGWEGSVDGYAGKYAKLAEHVRTRLGVAVVRAGNHEVHGHAFEAVCKARARGLIDGALGSAKSLCGRARPKLWLMGFSAGASAMAAVASDHPQVEKVLLVAPSSDAGHRAVVEGLRRFDGELFVLVGAEDDVVRDLPQQLTAAAGKAVRRELVVVPGCDHQFRGAKNGRILSQAPGWAFGGERGFPDPAGGLHLYD